MKTRARGSLSFLPFPPNSESLNLQHGNVISYGQLSRYHRLWRFLFLCPLFFFIFIIFSFLAKQRAVFSPNLFQVKLKSTCFLFPISLDSLTGKAFLKAVSPKVVALFCYSPRFCDIWVLKNKF